MYMYTGSKHVSTCVIVTSSYSGKINKAVMITLCPVEITIVYNDSLFPYSLSYEKHFVSQLSKYIAYPFWSHCA